MASGYTNELRSPLSATLTIGLDRTAIAAELAAVLENALNVGGILNFFTRDPISSIRKAELVNNRNKPKNIKVDKKPIL